MNSDVEDEAAKISVEEEMQLTNIRTLENDFQFGQLLPLSFHVILFIDFNFYALFQSIKNH